MLFCVVYVCGYGWYGVVVLVYTFLMKLSKYSVEKEVVRVYIVED